MKIREKILAGILTSAVTATAVVTALWPAAPAYAEYTVDFSQGDYSVWDGTSYTFDWYETPITEDGITTYTISSASDLAGLCILTNNLSAAEFADITSNIAAEDTGYISTVDTFEGKVIKLDCNIDLANFDWMPISYPWATANLTSRYEFTNAEGNVVTYNGVDYIPDDTVDPWVGDENGDPISTRYWEYPESELRFRDLMQGNLHDFKETTFSSDLLGEYFTYVYPYIPTDTVEKGVITPWVKIKDSDVTIPMKQFMDIDYSRNIVANYGLKNIKGYTETSGFLGTFEGKSHNIKGLTPKTPWTEDAEQRLITYDPIAKGLFGMLGETGVIKNLNVKGEYIDEVVSYSALLCAYNYGTIDSCYVDGKMKQSLIEMVYPVNRNYAPNGQSTYALSEQAGTVMPLGNSGFMTSQNYGTIKNSYTVGTVTQAFRSFGFFAATNYGTIENCENRASFSSEYVETDFITDEWSWSTDIALRKYTSPSITWVWTGTSFSGYAVPETLNVIRFNGSWTIMSYGIATSGKQLPFNFGIMDYGVELDRYKPWLHLPNITHYDTNRWVNVPWHTFDDMDNNAIIRSTSFLHFTTNDRLEIGGNDIEEGLGLNDWIVGLYDTAIGESIAANHLYGVYTQTTVGGIAAVNYGIIQDSTNKGNITNIYGVSPRNTFSQYKNSDRYADTTKARDYYSYIRPCNQYGMFSTAGSTASLAGGVVAQNFKIISGCNNMGTISNRDIRAKEAAYETPDDSCNTDFIAYTANGFYQNGTRFQEYGDGNDAVTLRDLQIYEQDNNDYAAWYLDDWIYSSMTSLWWMTEDYYNDVVCGEKNNVLRGSLYNRSTGEYEPIEFIYDCFDRNMPYPYVKDVICKAYIYNAGIAAQNSGSISHSKHSGTAEAAITWLNKGDANTEASIDWCENVGTVWNASIAYNNIDADISNCEADGTYILENNQYIAGIANFVEQCKGTVTTSNNYVYTGYGAFDVVTAKDRADIIDTYVYDTEHSGHGVATTMTNTNVLRAYNFQNSDAGVAQLNNCTIRDVYIFGICKDGFGSGTVTGESSNWNYFGERVNYMFGEELASAADTEASITGVNFYSYSTDGTTLGDVRYGSGKLTGLTINDFIAFANYEPRNVLKCYNCILNNLSIAGTSNTLNTRDDGVYVYYFEDTKCTDMLLQVTLDFDYNLYNQTLTLQNIPGILKRVDDTNTFTNCAVVTPDGMVSFPSKNASIIEDDTIRTDASLVYTPDAQKNGALAYAMDHGSSDARTFNYTVATEDSIDIFVGITDVLEMDRVLISKDVRKLPVYTRKIVDVTEKPYYAITVPFNGNGAGYLQANRVGTEYSTTDENAIFAHTMLFVQAGDSVAVNLYKHAGYDLAGIDYVTATATDALILNKENPIYTMIAPEQDVTLLARWSDIHAVEVDTSDWCNIITSCTGSVYGKTIRVQAQTLTDEFVVSRMYYCPYVLDDNNRKVLDLNTQVDIDMNTMEFVMPDTSVRIFAERSSTNNNILDFVIAGQHGEIDNIAHTITFTFEDSVDVTALTPDIISVPAGCTITPAADAVQDFSIPVAYRVTAPSGDECIYMVSVIPKRDGEITEFSLYQYKGNITDDGAITLTVPTTLDVTACIPSVVWSGIDITPAIDTVQDFTQPVTYIVTASDGTQRTYTVIVEHVSAEVPVGTIELNAADGTPLNVNIDYDRRRITVEYPYGLDVSELKVAALNFGGNTSINTGDSLNLTRYNYLSVTVEGNSTVFDIVGKEQPMLDKQITQFRLYGHDAVINEVEHTITLILPTKYDITDIAPDAVCFVGADITDITTRHDFTKPVVYTVSDTLGNTVDYTVIVKGE